ncbi:PASTA domain-containing protein [candidate division KSB1 bacterium]|nr:PASTA domain-containing protein [candidate division KSB1 bacterium]
MSRVEHYINRMIFIILCLLIFSAVLVIRIIQIQLIERGYYLKFAEEQYKSEKKLDSNRGEILDRNLQYLAVNKPVFSVGIDLSKLTDPYDAASKLSETFGDSIQYYFTLLTNSKKFIWIKRSIEDSLTHKIQSLQIPGISIVRETRRVYPEGKIAAHVVGFTDIDMNGLNGIEQSMDHMLKGSHGLAINQKDALGKNIAGTSHPVQEAKSGKNIVLTIDISFQRYATEELEKTLSDYDAESGIVCIINPQNGEILAMCNLPTFDPNDRSRSSNHSWRNRTITDAFEPGSTFKPIFMSSLLEEGIKKPDDIVFCHNGKYTIYNREIQDIHGYGWLSIDKIIANSSNIGMSKLSLEVKQDIIYQYARDFGFGVKTGIELIGEIPGTLKSTLDWSRHTPIAMSTGYEVSVTALQMAMAYGAIANGGNLLKPQILLADYESTHPIIRRSEPVVIRRVMSTETSQMLVDMLKEVVDDGTGTRAQIAGIDVAGKTGTAWRYDPKLKEYSYREFRSSFIGFFPAYDPEILILVMIDNPRGDYYGGIVAASTFKRIALKIIRKMQIESKPSFKSKIILAEANQPHESTVTLPDLVSRRIDFATEILDDMGLEFNVMDNGDIVISQHPAPGSLVDRNSVVQLNTKSLNAKDDTYTTVPKVIGKTVREALKSFAQSNLHVLVRGSGRVVRQEPEAGSRIRRGARCVIDCEPTMNLAEFVSW